MWGRQRLLVVHSSIAAARENDPFIVFGAPCLEPLWVELVVRTRGRLCLVGVCLVEGQHKSQRQETQSLPLTSVGRHRSMRNLHNGCSSALYWQAVVVIAL